MSFSYPAPGADIFGELQKGSVIVLSRGAGSPPVEDVSTSEVILAVEGFSALTNTGRLLCCADSHLIEATGDHLAEGEYEVSPEAQELLRQATHQKIEDGFEPQYNPLF